MHWITPNWTRTLNSQKYPIYNVRYKFTPLPEGPNFSPFPSRTSGFQDIAHFIIRPPELTTMLHIKKKEHKKCQKFNMSNFTIHWTFTLVETLPRSIHEFLGANLVCSFRGDVIWTFTPILSHVSENEKYLAKIQNFKFHNSLNNFGRDPPQEYAWFFGSASGAYFQRKCHLKFFVPYGPILTKTKKKFNKRSIDLGALRDTCNWCDKWQFSTDLFRSNIWPTKLLYKIKGFEIWVTLTLSFQGHSRSYVMMSLDSPYMLSY